MSVGASQVVQWVKNPPAMQEMQEMQFLSLGWDDPLEEDMATHSSILAWRIPWTEEPGGVQSIGSQRSDTAEGTEHPCVECGPQQRGNWLRNLSDWAE